MAEVKISLIKSDSSEYNITKANGLKVINSLTQLTPNPTEIKYGILKNSGEVTIVDEENELLKKILENQIDPNKTNLFVKVNGNNVQKHNIISNDYNHSTNTLKFQLSNDMEKFENIRYNSYGLPNCVTMYELLSDCLTFCGYSALEIDSLLDKYLIYGDNNYGTVKQYLQKITIKGINFPDISASELITMICEACQLAFIEDDNGNKKFISLRPIEKHEVNYISIPSNKQRNILSYNLITNNQYEAVELQEYQFNTEIVSKNMPLADITENSKIIYINTPIMDREHTSTIPSNYSFETYGDWLIITFNANGLKNKSECSIDTDILYYVLRWSVDADKTKISELSSAVVSDQLRYYSSLADFKTWLSTMAQSYHAAGIKEDFLNEDTGPYNQPMTYFLALKISDGDVIIRDFAFLLGGDAELKYLDKKPATTIYGNSSSTKTFKMENQFFIDDNYFQYSQETTQKILPNLFAQNILNDYSKGIRGAKVSIFCSNFYDKNDDLAKDWAQGQTIQNTDILRFEHQDNLDTYIGIEKWKTTGRAFKYDGKPYIDLELQEIKYLDNVMKITSSDVSAITIGDDTYYAPNGAYIASMNDNYYIWFKIDSITNTATVNSSSTDASSITIPDIINFDGVDYLVTAIRFDAFSEASVSQIRLSNYLKEIQNSVFASCENLETISLPQSLETIGTNAFRFNSGLTSIVIPNRVRSIGSAAFGSCTSLYSAYLPKNLTEISTGLFAGCSNLGYVSVGERINSIGNNAFYGCNNLEQMDIKAVVPPTLSASALPAVSDLYFLFKIRVPGMAVEAYKNAPVWSTYADYIIAL